MNSEVIGITIRPPNIFLRNLDGPELSTESDGLAGRVGSGHDFAGFWRVGSGRVFTLDILVFY